MNILIVDKSVIPAIQYGGTERVIWYLGKELVKLGHKVVFLVKQGSHCDFAEILPIDETRLISEQIPENIDVIHLNFQPKELFEKPYLTTMHGNINDQRELNINTVFVSRNHAERFGSSSFVYNGMDWDDYGRPDFNKPRKYFHFLGKAAWSVKNLNGAIKIIHSTSHEKLAVLGGYRLNFNMGFRLTLTPRAKFYGMVGGEKKLELLNTSKGLVFPVRWNEPFGLAITESLYFGCPVLGTPYGSLPELIIPEVGVLSDQSETLTKAAENIDSFSKKRCHEYARDRFNSEIMALDYLKKYEKVLNGETLNNTCPKLLQIQTTKLLPFE
jgi:glycosyltransferase involved in cell wall biosynthesis